MMSRENSKHFWTRKGLKDKLPETFTKNDIRLLKPTFVVLLVRHDQLLILEQPQAWVCETVTSGKSCFKIKTSIYKRTVKFTYCLTRLWSGLNYFDLNYVFLVVSLFSIKLKLLEQLTGVILQDVCQPHARLWQLQHRSGLDPLVQSLPHLLRG